MQELWRKIFWMQLKTRMVKTPRNIFGMKMQGFYVYARGEKAMRHFFRCHFSVLNTKYATLT